MSQLEAPSVPSLEERLSRGADLLFEMEQRDDRGPEYARWLQHWIELLQQYELRHSA